MLLGSVNLSLDIAACREDKVVEEELVFFSDLNHLVIV